ncbi:maleylpyruvate isomerase family mycothiol-dependent enzyme [Streptomyces sp. NPDC050535]|uniref:maleylpyruvate isomerase family mycothiol-dependent enzyme n=1 Tax=Streptomyces sp. NPDC050535 TaxID=3365626 RepID=UPI00378EE3D6
MSTEHEDVRDLLAAWAFDALPPAERQSVSAHLADCESCAAEARRLRETVRLLDGPLGEAHAGLPDEADAGLPGAAGSGERSESTLALALRSRRAAPPVAAHAAPYAAAVSGLRALLRELDGRGPWGTPVVHDWDVHSTVAHLIAADEPLAVTLGLDAHLPAPGPVPDGTWWQDAWAARTAEVIAHELGRTPEETVAAWSDRAAALLATPEARNPEPASLAPTLMGARLPVADHFVVRAFEAWIHTDDIGRALGIAVPPPPDPHLWQLVRLAVRVLGRALGATAPPVLFTVAGTGGEGQWVLGSEDEPVRAELVLDPVDLCLLMGGRLAPADVPRGAAGDDAAIDNVLTRAASLAWL